MPSGEYQQTPMDQGEDLLYAMQLVTGSVLSMAMHVAIELNVFEIIAKAGPTAQLSPKDIVQQLPSNNPDAESLLERILRLFTSHSILISTVVTRDSGLVERLYGLSAVGKYFVQNEDGVSFAPGLLLIQDKAFMDSWYHLKDAILEGGIPFNKVHGMHAFEYLGKDSRFNRVFNEAMFNLTKTFAKKMVEIYKGFEDLTEIVDVGGGLGCTISAITSKYPKIKGINYDLPHVLKDAPSYPGVEHVGGDMFKSVPNGEAIFMKWILHDWDDERCLTLLKNCYKALPENGKLIIVEAVVPVEAETNSVAKSVCQTDVNMMTQYVGGIERTEEEFNTLAKRAGFAGVKKICGLYTYWVMEFYKM